MTTEITHMLVQYARMKDERDEIDDPESPAYLRATDKLKAVAVKLKGLGYGEALKAWSGNATKRADHQAQRQDSRERERRARKGL